MRIQDIPTEDLNRAVRGFAEYPQAKLYKFYQYVDLGEKRLSMTEDEANEASVKRFTFDKDEIFAELAARQKELIG